MANKNYLVGRRLEYEVMKMLREHGMETTRTAGSHGWVDIVAKYKKKAINPSHDWSREYTGFKPRSVTNNPMKLVRIGRTYIDTLYVWVYRDYPGWSALPVEPWTVVHLIQCKRKKVK